MKFKVTPKDFMIFLIYCVVLLYFCAIAVVNFVSLAQEGKLVGFLSSIFPFKAFIGESFFYTIGLFVVVLIFIFTTVSSYIFEKDKSGSFGIHVMDKPSDGYAKWATEKEIKADKGIVRVCPKDNNIDAAGIPIINKGEEMWVDNGEYHNLIIGASGSGKTECVVKPLVNLLSKKGESMVITDPKGEIYEYCGEYLKNQGYNIIILNFREPNKGNAWNPLTLPYQYYKKGAQDKGIELLDDVALNILFDKKKGGSDSDFWEKSAADYFSGLALALFMDAKEKEINFNSINYMSTIGEEKRGISTYIKEYFTMKGEDSAAYMFASNTINSPSETKGGILSTFRQKIRLFSTREALSEMLAYSDFDMRDIGNKKTAVFMIIHDEKKTYHGLMTIFIKQCYETLIDCAYESGGKLKFRTNFILDEFANMPPLKDVDSMVTAARSRDIRFTFIIQNFAQLNDVYGEEVAQVIKGNCGNLVYLISTELKALEEISKMCGEVKSKDKDKTASTPLITVSDLQKLKLFEAIIIRWRKSPFRTKLTPNFKIDWGINFGKTTLPQRKNTDIELFDIKKFVNEHIKSNNNVFGGPGMGGNPFMNGGFNPFGPNPFMNSPANNNNPFLDANSMKPANKKPMFSEDEEKEIDKMVQNIENKLKSLPDSNKDNSPKDDDIELIKPIKHNTPSLDEINASIEAAIKKLEEEEAKNNKANDTEDELDLTQEIKMDDVNKPVISVDKDSVVVNENVVADDEYFDDFFDDK